MTEITLKGILGKKFGSKWFLEVRSILEIFEAIEANTLRVSKFFKNVEKFATHFIVFVDGKIVPAYLINSKILKKESKVEIVPILQGGGIELLIIGILLIVLSVILMKLLSPKLPKDISTSSSILGGVRNVLNRNIPVPVGYGRLRVGSAVVSNNTIVTPR